MLDPLGGAIALGRPMPSDAKIMRELGVDGLRAYWREKARKQYWANRDNRHCEDCQAELTGRTKARLCADCRRARKRARDHRRKALTATVPCRACGDYFTRVYGGRRRYCSDRCAVLAKQAGNSCPVHYGSCVECGASFSARSPRTYCSTACYRRRYMREYFRKNHKTAISYWRVANTPEAQALAETMFTLRQELRRQGVKLSPK